MNINGTRFDDPLSATAVVKEVLKGRAGDDEFTFFDQDFSDTFLGGSGDDVLMGIEFVFESADDYSAARRLKYDGGRGYDTVVFDIDVETEGSARINLGAFKLPNVKAEQFRYNFELSRSGDDSDILRVVGTGADEYIQARYVTSRSGDGAGDVRFNLKGGDDTFVAFGFRGGWDSLEVKTGGGKDQVFLDFSADGARILTGNGADIVYTSGANREIINLGRGNDDIVIRGSGFSTEADVVRTGAGNDRIHIDATIFGTLAQVVDFDEARDAIVFEEEQLEDFLFIDETPPGLGPNITMNNVTGELFYRSNLLIDFGGPTNLTLDNFIFDDSIL